MEEKILVNKIRRVSAESPMSWIKEKYYYWIENEKKSIECEKNQIKILKYS